ncbi:hypothetical protein JCM5350_003917 [Sporobolomyces pararoseus]
MQPPDDGAVDLSSQRKRKQISQPTKALPETRPKQRKKKNPTLVQCTCTKCRAGDGYFTYQTSYRKKKHNKEDKERDMAIAHAVVQPSAENGSKGLAVDGPTGTIKMTSQEDQTKEELEIDRTSTGGSSKSQL